MGDGIEYTGTEGQEAATGQEYWRPPSGVPSLLIPVVAEPPLLSILNSEPKKVSRYWTLMSLEASKRMTSKVTPWPAAQSEQSFWQTSSNWMTKVRLGAEPRVS